MTPEQDSDPVVDGWPTELPRGYDAERAKQDRRDLATLRSSDVNWRVRRRLRHRVGGEGVLLERLAAWERHVALAGAQVSPQQARLVAHEDALALATEYRDVCEQLYGAGDRDVLANAAAIARGDVLPWDARHVIEGERSRLARRHPGPGVATP